MQEKDGHKNLLRSNTRNQRQQIQPSRDIKNHGVRDKIYCEDAIEDGGHLSLLPNHSALLNSIVTPWRQETRINSQLSTISFPSPLLLISISKSLHLGIAASRTNALPNRLNHSALLRSCLAVETG